MPQGPSNWPKPKGIGWDHSVDENGTHTVRAIAPFGVASRISWNAQGLQSVQQHPDALASGITTDLWNHASSLAAADPDNIPAPAPLRYGFLSGKPRVNRGI